MDIAEIKRTLRKIRHLEQKIRFRDAVDTPRPVLVWDAFFDLRERPLGRAKYTLPRLLSMSREEYRAAINEYWEFFWQSIFNEGDEDTLVCRDNAIYLGWGLPPDADAATVRKKFRELAKLSHPDTGGSDGAFIKLMAEYKKLIGK